MTAGSTAAGAAEKEASGDVFPFKVHKQTLDNGLQMVVIPYDSPGTVAYYTVVRTGSRDEVEPGHSGFAHFFEHMMFRGTEKYSQEPTTTSSSGWAPTRTPTPPTTGRSTTSSARSSELATMMDIESDRFQNLKYTEDAFRTEALAVLGEYNKNVSNPFLPMYEKMRDLAFTKHTYKHTTIGFLDDIKAMPGLLRLQPRLLRPVLPAGERRRCWSWATSSRSRSSRWRRSTTATGRRATRRRRWSPSRRRREAKKGHIDWPNPTRPALHGRLPRPGLLHHVHRTRRPWTWSASSCSASRPLSTRSWWSTSSGSTSSAAARTSPAILRSSSSSPGSSPRTSSPRSRRRSTGTCSELAGPAGGPAAARPHQVAPALRLRPRARHARRRRRPGGRGRSPLTGDVGRHQPALRPVPEGDAGGRPAGRPRDVPAAERDRRDPVAQGRRPASRPAGRPGRCQP